MCHFIERHSTKIRGTISCLDRVVITGTIPNICYADGMTAFLYAKGIRIFDYTKWAEPLRDMIRLNAEKLACDNGLETEYIRKKSFRKESRVKEIIRERGDRPGLVHIFSALEPCTSYRPWHNKKTLKTFLKYTDGKCLHYYFYFITPELGLCYLRVPTWAPFRLQFYYNGHNELAGKLNSNGIAYKMVDNAFIEVDDFEKAQRLSDNITPKVLNKTLNKIAEKYCPVIKEFSQGYHWSLMQVEYATDIIFNKHSDLAPICEEFVRTAIHAVKVDNIATFLGRKLTGQYQGEAGTNFHTGIEGTRIKHRMDKVSIKMYDKHGIVLRIETTANDVSFFKHYRWVEHRDGTDEMKLAPMKKNIYSLPALVKKNRKRLQILPHDTWSKDYWHRVEVARNVYYTFP